MPDFLPAADGAAESGGISNIPQIGWLGLLAQALAKIKSVGGQLSPLASAATRQIGEAPRILEDASYQFPPTRGTGMATQIDPGVLDVANLIPAGKIAGVAKALMGAKAATGTGMAALAGVLRPGGDSRLILAHTTPEIKREITSPSMAVEKDWIPSRFGDTVLVPRAGAFDPAYDTSTMFNRDAYTPRWQDYRSGYNPSPEARYMDKYADLLPGGALAKKENSTSNIPQFGSHDVAIAESPHFQSFKHYETSPRGSALLTMNEGKVSDYAGRFDTARDDLQKQLMDALAQKHGINPDEMWGMYVSNQLPPDVAAQYKQLDHIASIPWQDWKNYVFGEKGAGPNVQEATRSLIKMARGAPSEYGELKVHGPVPVNPERFAGVITPYSRQAQQARDLGLPVTKIPEYSNPFERFQAAAELQRQAPAYGKKDPGDINIVWPPKKDELPTFAPKTEPIPMKKPDEQGSKFEPGTEVILGQKVDHTPLPFNMAEQLANETGKNIGVWTDIGKFLVNEKGEVLSMDSNMPVMHWTDMFPAPE